MAARLNPYLHFAGNAREAMDFYRSLGKVPVVLRKEIESGVGEMGVSGSGNGASGTSTSLGSRCSPGPCGCATHRFASAVNAPRNSPAMPRWT